MRFIYFTLLISTILVSCKKESRQKQQPTSETPSVPAVLLKDLVLSGLPSPYYHFEYNSDGKVIVANFASGYYIYDVFYLNGRISEMRNNILVNKDRLQYFYDETGKVNSVTYADS